MPISQEYLIFARGERLHVRLQIVCLSYSEILQRSGIFVRLSYATSQKHNYYLRHHSTRWKASPSDNDYAAARASVAALHEAAVPILAGSDANKRSQGAAKVAYGDGLHRELELLVDAGLSSVEALRAATSEGTRAFGLGDRGAIKVGMRADLVLLSGNPVEDIRATQTLKRVWCRGIECEL